jgi:hypothetical protein
MKKLKLTVEALRVESFETADQEMGRRGTVRGNASASTCAQRDCDCHDHTEWDASCATCIDLTCEAVCYTDVDCPTYPNYPGC